MPRPREVEPRLAVPLVALALGGAGAVVTRILPAWTGALGLVALPPLDLFGDVRLIVTEATTVPRAAAMTVVSLGLRSAVMAVMLGGLSRTNVRRAILFYAVLLIPAALHAGVAFAAGASLYHGLFWIGLAIAMIAAVIAAPLPWSNDRRNQPDRLVVLGYLLAFMILGLVAERAGGALLPFFLLVSAGLTYLWIRWLRGGVPRLLPHIAGAGAGMVAIAVLAILTLGPTEHPDPPERGGTLFLLPGLDTASGVGTLFEFDPAWLGFPCDRTVYYSYRGTGEGAERGVAVCPIDRGAPYDHEDTQREFYDLVDFFHDQVEELEGPVTVVTHSQSGWFAWRALAEREHTNVSHLILIGHFPESLSYPPPGASGPGRLGGMALRAVTAAARATGFSNFDPDAPLAMDLFHEVGRLRAIHDPAPRGVRVLNLPSALDLPLIPGGRSLRGASDGCPEPAPHAVHPLDPPVAVAVNAFLDGREGPCALWNEPLGKAPRVFSPPPRR